jgi:hypothetical protein
MRSVETTKSIPKCPTCGNDRERRVYQGGAQRGNAYWYCSCCATARSRKWRIDNPERERALRQVSLEREKQKDRADPTRGRARLLRKRYAMSLDDYDSMSERQSGRCAVCGTNCPGGPGSVLHVDHDHSCCPGQKTCGKCVRGLLCDKCNKALGYADDSIDTLLSMVAYLQSHSKVE